MLSARKKKLSETCRKPAKRVHKIQVLRWGNNVSEDLASSVFRVSFTTSSHGVRTQKRRTWISITVKTLSLSLFRNW